MAVTRYLTVDNNVVDLKEVVAVTDIRNTGNCSTCEIILRGGGKVTVYGVERSHTVRMRKEILDAWQEYLGLTFK